MADDAEVRRVGPADARLAARLLDDFNREFDAPTPGADDLGLRLERLLADGAEPDLVVLMVGEPAVGLAVLAFRPSVWGDGPIGALDELYVQPGQRGRGLGSLLLRAVEAEALRRGGNEVQINVDGGDIDARRFYERHGYRNVDSMREDQMLVYIRDLDEGA